MLFIIKQLLIQSINDIVIAFAESHGKTIECFQCLSIKLSIILRSDQLTGNLYK